jgi:hypothetical protein
MCVSAPALGVCADCAPGLAMDASRNCKACSVGKYCLGGDETVNPNNTDSTCPDGLATTFLGAKSQAQCFTKPGYGRVTTRISDGTTSLSGVLCPVGEFNVGSNTAGCQKCGVGLTTATNGSTMWSDCSESPLQLFAAAAAAGVTPHHALVRRLHQLAALIRNY